jgi:hypothetical protein
MVFLLFAGSRAESRLCGRGFQILRDFDQDTIDAYSPGRAIALDQRREEHSNQTEEDAERKRLGEEN